MICSYFVLFLFSHILQNIHKYINHILRSMIMCFSQYQCQFKTVMERADGTDLHRIDVCRGDDHPRCPKFERGSRESLPTDKGIK